MKWTEYVEIAERLDIEHGCKNPDCTLPVPTICDRFDIILACPELREQEREEIEQLLSEDHHDDNR